MTLDSLVYRRGCLFCQELECWNWIFFLLNTLFGLLLFIIFTSKKILRFKETFLRTFSTRHTSLYIIFCNIELDTCVVTASLLYLTLEINRLAYAKRLLLYQLSLGFLSCYYLNVSSEIQVSQLVADNLLLNCHYFI